MDVFVKKKKFLKSNHEFLIFRPHPCNIVESVCISDLWRCVGFGFFFPIFYEYFSLRNIIHVLSINCSPSFIVCFTFIFTVLELETCLHPHYRFQSQSRLPWKLFKVHLLDYLFFQITELSSFPFCLLLHRAWY